MRKRSRDTDPRTTIEFEVLDGSAAPPSSPWADRTATEAVLPRDGWANRAPAESVSRSGGPMPARDLTETVSVSDHQFGGRGSTTGVAVGVIGCLVGVVGILFALGSGTREERAQPTTTAAPPTTAAPTTTATTVPEISDGVVAPDSFHVDPVPADKLAMLPYSQLYFVGDGTGYVFDAATGEGTRGPEPFQNVVRTGFGNVLLSSERLSDAAIDITAVHQAGDDVWATDWQAGVIVRVAVLANESRESVPLDADEQLIGVMADGRPVVRAVDGRGYSVDPAGVRTRIAEGDVDSVVNGHFVERICDEAASCQDVLHGVAVTPAAPSGTANYTFSPDGASVVALYERGRVELIDVATGFPFISTNVGWSQISADQVAWAPDGHSVAFFAALRERNLLVVMDRQRRDVLMIELPDDVAVSAVR